MGFFVLINQTMSRLHSDIKNLDTSFYVLSELSLFNRLEELNLLLTLSLNQSF